MDNLVSFKMNKLILQPKKLWQTKYVALICVKRLFMSQVEFYLHFVYSLATFMNIVVLVP